MNIPCNVNTFKNRYIKGKTVGSKNDLIDNFDSSKIIQEVSKILGGKGGGGRKDIAQAGGTEAAGLSTLTQSMLLLHPSLPGKIEGRILPS